MGKHFATVMLLGSLLLLGAGSLAARDLPHSSQTTIINYPQTTSEFTTELAGNTWLTCDGTVITFTSGIKYSFITTNLHKTINSCGSSSQLASYSATAEYHLDYDGAMATDAAGNKYKVMQLNMDDSAKNVVTTDPTNMKFAFSNRARVAGMGRARSATFLCFNQCTGSLVEGILTMQCQTEICTAECVKKSTQTAMTRLRLKELWD